MIIDGRTLTWQNGTISSTGGKSASQQFIRTSDFLALSSKTLTFLSPIYNANNKHYSAFVCQYSSNNDASFIQRDVLLTTSADVGETVSLVSNCAYVKFVFGHPAATGIATDPSEGAAIRIEAVGGRMSLRSRRRALMAVGGGNSEVSAFVPGTYTSIYGTNPKPTSIVASNGTISSDAAVCYGVTIPLTKPVQYKTGDSVSFRQNRSYTSLGGYRYVTLKGSANWAIITNVGMGNYKSVTVVAENDGYFDTILFDNSTSKQAATVKPELYINDVLVVG